MSGTWMKGALAGVFKGMDKQTSPLSKERGNFPLLSSSVKVGLWDKQALSSNRVSSRDFK
jgi:hypothetical protein